MTLLASAQHKVNIEGIWYNLDLETGQAEVTYAGPNAQAYVEYSGDLTIPATVNYENKEYRVTSIGDEAFYECNKLTDVELPEGLERIGNKAFVACTELWYINFPTSLKSIGEEAFYYCQNFGYNGKLDLTLPEGLESIGSRAFKSTGISDMSIPESVTSIGEGVFMYCWHLYSVTLPQGMTSIGAEMFAASNISTVNISETVTTIGTSAFQGCSQLTSIALPKALENIDDNAFYGCRKLTGITIPEGVITIGTSAFHECMDIVRINFLGRVESIGAKAFNLGSKTIDIYCYSEEPPFIDNTVFSCNRDKSVLHVPESAIDAYLEEWGRIFRNIVALTNEEMSIDNLEMIGNGGLSTAIYDLTGRRVVSLTKDGIYIVGNKKVVVKD